MALSFLSVKKLTASPKFIWRHWAIRSRRQAGRTGHPTVKSHPVKYPLQWRELSASKREGVWWPSHCVGRIPSTAAEQWNQGDCDWVATWLGWGISGMAMLYEGLLAKPLHKGDKLYKYIFVSESASLRRRRDLQDIKCRSVPLTGYNLNFTTGVRWQRPERKRALRMEILTFVWWERH